MDTPIRDFVRDYIRQSPLRLHMPGHKGIALLGPEAMDITEVEGAGVLYQGDGIIAQSERNAASLFDTAATLYSAEGSSLCIRAMLYLALLHARERGIPPRIAAARNVHTSFLSGVALLDLEVDWLSPAPNDGLLFQTVRPEELEALFSRPEAPTAVYVTCPDYLGNLPDIRPLAEISHRHGALLLVDNAHGAYLRFLSPSRHPMDLGADLCCDSAHKTLPALTGGAYLQISKTAPASLAGQAPNAMALFASTSPSYLILQSLDETNRYLSEGYAEKLAAFTPLAAQCKERLQARGWTLVGNEPLKLALAPKSYGFTGQELARLLARDGISAEFADPDFAVMMLSPELGLDALEQLETVLRDIPRRRAIQDLPPPLPLRPTRVLSPRQALLSPQETIPVEQALDRILGSVAVSCPPAVPVLVCGERIDERAVRCFQYYKITECHTVRPPR